jgi:hypothetical protein
MIVCADDYGLRDDIDRAILELSGVRKLSAASCMVVLERCTPAALARLLAHQSRLDLGLHLCLTDENLSLSALPDSHQGRHPLPSFRTLLLRDLRGQIELGAMTREISAQYTLFVDKSGRRPDFIDGHLHVHQFPGVRRALLEFIHNLPAGSRPYIRNTHLPLRKLWARRLPWLKSGFIGLRGARMLKKLKSAGALTNQGFAGIYDFRRWSSYREYLPRFVACLPDPNAILVVHPGFNEDWRRQEFEALREFVFASGMPNRFCR